MNIENCVITNLPCCKDITCNLLALREIVKNMKDWEIVVGEVPQTRL